MIQTGEVMPIRVLVAAPYAMSRAGLAALVGDDPRLTLAGQAGSPDALIAAAEEQAPGAVLLDPADEPEDWLQPLWQYAESRALPPVLTIVASVPAATEALRSGATGVLLRDASPEEIGAALVAVSLGLSVVDRRVAGELVAQLDTAVPAEPVPATGEALTAREREVLTLIARGLPNKAIALELGISEHTVKFHVGSILNKLGAASRAEALARAARLGLIAL